MKTVNEVKIYIYLQKWGWQEEPEIVVSSCESEDTDYKVLVSSRHISVEIPKNFDMRPQQIKALLRKKEEIQATAQKELVEVEEKIQKLLAIDYKQAA